MSKIKQIHQLYRSIFKEDLYLVENVKDVRDAFWNIQKNNYSTNLLGFLPDKIRSLVNISNFIYESSSLYDEIIVFAFDAISFDYYLSDIEQVAKEYKLLSSVLSSVFPSTSTTAWTSIITGSTPSEHGIYGTSFYLKEFDKNYNWIFNALADKEKFISLWKPKKDPHLNLSNKKTIFSRLKDVGFTNFYLDSHGKMNPFPVLGITDGAKHIPYLKGDFDELKRKPKDLLAYFLNQTSKLLQNNRGKKIIWNYLDVDDFIHENGYKELSKHDIWKALFKFWSVHKTSNRIFMLISDHGQTNQVNSGINILKTSILNEDLAYNSAGAGRTMFFYPKKEKMNEVKFWLEKIVGDSGLVLTKEELITHGLIERNAVALDRIGDLITLATKPNFPSAGAKYFAEHGSLHSEEMFVPLIIQAS